VPARRQILALRIVTAGIAAMLSTTAISGTEPLHLDVFVHEGVGLAPEIAAGGREAVARIFNRLDVQVVWLDRQPPACRPGALDNLDAQRDWLRSLFMIRLVATAATPRANVPSAAALGFAIPGTRVASVIYPRVEQLARESGSDAAMVLGHVMAHELGHLLLRQSSHSVAGLMQGRFDAVVAQQGRLLFGDEEASAIRARLSADQKQRSAGC
jgi:hypothetical protein